MAEGRMRQQQKILLLADTDGLFIRERRYQNGYGLHMVTDENHEIVVPYHWSNEQISNYLGLMGYGRPRTY